MPTATDAVDTTRVEVAVARMRALIDTLHAVGQPRRPTLRPGTLAELAELLSEEFDVLEELDLGRRLTSDSGGDSDANR